MATVVNVIEFQKRFETLGWTAKVNLSEVVDGITNANIPATALVAYLDALIAAPSNLNDQSIANCPAATATKITNYFKGLGLEAS